MQLKKKETEHTDLKRSLKLYLSFTNFTPSFNTPSLNNPFPFDINKLGFLNCTQTSHSYIPHINIKYTVYFYKFLFLRLYPNFTYLYSAHKYQHSIYAHKLGSPIIPKHYIHVLIFHTSHKKSPPPQKRNNMPVWSHKQMMYDNCQLKLMKLILSPHHTRNVKNHYNMNFQFQLKIIYCIYQCP